MLKHDNQMEIIAEYYKGTGDYVLNEERSNNYRHVHISAENGSWLVLERKVENAVQVHMPDGNGVIKVWDDYVVRNADIRLTRTICLSEKSHCQIEFSSLELQLIDRYGDYDRRITMEKFESLSGRFMDPEVVAAVKSAKEKLGRISDQTYKNLFSVGQKRKEVDAERSIRRRLERGRRRLDKAGAECKMLTRAGRKEQDVCR